MCVGINFALEAIAGGLDRARTHTHLYTEDALNDVAALADANAPAPDSDQACGTQPRARGVRGVRRMTRAMVEQHKTKKDASPGALDRPSQRAQWASVPVHMRSKFGVLARLPKGANLNDDQESVIRDAVRSILLFLKQVDM